ncbi:MAG: MBL fold metallo-hydrolase [Helicobacteraceae bacterium]|jgi:glyoxylase-like metal-dependent hydrolase (beta-lactamase superfamily II)|nr:MBL fold metallo-hydrolase [Helicobacteraceae bacterium]
MKKFWTVFLTALIGIPIMNTAALAEAEIFAFKLGDAEFISFVTSRRNISDDTFTTPELLEKYKKTPGYAASAINYFLLKDKGEYTLFDAGLGKSADDDIVANLAKVGVKPSEIKRIFLTHMHGDHIGGLIDNNKVVFPNALLYISNDEMSYWRNQGDKLAVQVMTLYEKNNALKGFFFGDRPITPFIQHHALIGHTPGHVYYIVGETYAAAKSPEDSVKNIIWVVGDIIHADIQFTEPKIALRYDVDPATAYLARRVTLIGAAVTKARIAGMHLSGSGVGKVERPDGKVESFRFIPINGD